MNKIIIVMLLAGISLQGFAQKAADEETLAKQQKMLVLVGSMLEQKHYSPKPIDDDFSEAIWERYIKHLDPRKEMFLQTDIVALKKYQNGLDEEIHGTSPITYLPAVLRIFNQRFHETAEQYSQALSVPFHFTKKEKGLPAVTGINFPANETEKGEISRKHIKFMVLQTFVKLQEQRKPGSLEYGHTDAQLEKEAREAIGKRIALQKKRTQANLDEEKQFVVFVNTIVKYMDPHTDYFPPVESRGFQETVSNRFFGIGAQMQERDGLVTIADLESGGPALKSGQVQIGDVIAGVGEGADGEITDVTAVSIVDVTKLIRGNKGTTVRLSLKKADGSLKTVAMAREEIVPGDGLAKIAIVKQGQNKLGYIMLPKFYDDATNPDGPHCANDVAAALEIFKKEKVDGVVMDLRTNGGGSLREVIRMVELFTKGGPVVQVRARGADAIPLKDSKTTQIYDGPLVVMVNELTASASEIFAAAIQNYHRGIIIGSTSTYGKGSVQSPFPIGGNPANGALKLTYQMFYRIDGSTTQMEGVKSDIVLPDVYEFQKVREKDNDSALPWDMVANAGYTTDSLFNLKKLQTLAAQRIKNDSVFTILSKNITWLSENQSADLPLDLTSYNALETTRQKIAKQDERLLKLPAGKEMIILPAGGLDVVKNMRNQEWFKKLSTDIYIDQAVKVIRDMIK